MVRTFLASTVALVLCAAPVFAADAATEVSAMTVTVNTATAAPFSAALAAAPATTSVVIAPTRSSAQTDWYKSTQRPAVLPALYVGSALLQGFDAYSTLKALHNGAVEANPMMKGVVGSPLALIGVKAAITTSAIMASERMWRNHNRTGAIVLMAVSNGMMAWVAEHNASVISGLQH